MLVIIPARNEAGNLPTVLAEVRQWVPDADIVVIDDASTDDTVGVAIEMGAQVLSLPCNLGYGGAVQTGFRFAVERGYDYAILLDADGQHDPRCVVALAAPVLAGDADVAIGSRFLGETSYRATWTRRAGMALFAAIVSRLTGRRVTDPTSGFQALNRRALRFFAKDNYPSDYPDADTLLALHYAGFCVVEVPVCMRDRLSGLSMHGSWRVVYYIFKMLLSILNILLRQKTLRPPWEQAPGTATPPTEAAGQSEHSSRKA